MTMEPVICRLDHGQLDLGLTGEDLYNYEPHQQSLMIQYLDRVFDPGMAEEWQGFWRLHDYRRALKDRSQRMSLDRRWRSVRNESHLEAMEFFDKAPDNGESDYE